jgi:hypothetical protein
MIPSVILLIGDTIYGDVNNILVKLKVTEDLCRKYLAEEQVFTRKNHDNLVLVPVAESKGIIYPLPDEINNFEASLILEKEHNAIAERVTAAEFLRIIQTYKQEFRMYTANGHGVFKS